MDLKNKNQLKNKQFPHNIDHQFNRRNVYPSKIKRIPLVILQSDLSGESYAESSEQNLPILHSNKHYMNKAQRDRMELRRIQLNSLPTHSSESSVEEYCTEKKIGPYMKRKTKLESDLIWRKYNEFLIRSIDYMENYKSSSSDSEQNFEYYL